MVRRLTPYCFLFGICFFPFGFTSGYPDGKLGAAMFGTRTKEDVTSATSSVFSRLHGLYREERSHIPVTLSLIIKSGSPVLLTVQDNEGHMVQVESDSFPEPAVNRSLDKERCLSQLRKTGGTPFLCQNAVCQLEPGLSVPISLINRLRRQVLAEMLEQRSYHPHFLFHASNGGTPSHSQAAHSQTPCIFYPSRTSLRKCQKLRTYLAAAAHTLPQLLRLREDGYQVGLALPRAFFGGENMVRRLLEERMQEGFVRTWCGNLGAVAVAHELGAELHAGFSLNLTNTSALRWLQENNFSSAELSFELTLQQCASLGADIPRGIIAYGYLPMMLCRNCPAANSPQGCRNCKETPYLRDRKNTNFPIQCTRTAGYQYTEILNSVPLSLCDRKREILNQDFVVFRFTVENNVETETIIRQFMQGENPYKTYTRGLYYRGWEQC